MKPVEVIDKLEREGFIKIKNNKLVVTKKFENYVEKELRKKARKKSV